MNRDFKGIWIPKELWLNTELTMQEKIFLVEIDSLDNEEGCFASNAYFAEFFQLSKSRVSQIIKSLETKELIIIDYIYKSNSKEIDKRIIRINKEKYLEILGIKNSKEGIKNSKDGIKNSKDGIKNSKDRYLENAADNNIINNNIINKLSNINDTQKNNNLIPSLNSNSKNKKSKDIATMRSMINAFTQNEYIREKLLEYFNLRIKKGLQPNQWQIILDDLRDFAGEDSSIAIDKINGAIAGGYMQIIAPWEKDRKRNFSKPKFDNTAGHKVEAVVNMTEEERRKFEESLATDENGNLLRF